MRFREKITDNVYLQMKPKNLGGLLVVSSLPGCRNIKGELPSLVEEVGENYGIFLVDYAAIMGRDYSNIKRIVGNKNEIIKFIKNNKRILELKEYEIDLVSFLDKKPGTRIPEILDCISSGIPLNIYLGNHLAKKFTSNVLLEPKIMELETQFDLLLTPSGQSSLILVEIKRSYKRLRKNRINIECLTHIMKIIQLLGIGSIHNLQQIKILMIFLTLNSPSKEVKRHCDKLSRGFTKNLRILNPISEIKLWSGTIEELGEIYL